MICNTFSLAYMLRSVRYILKNIFELIICLQTDCNVPYSEKVIFKLLLHLPISTPNIWPEVALNLSNFKQVSCYYQQIVLFWLAFAKKIINISFCLISCQSELCPIKFTFLSHLKGLSPHLAICDKSGQRWSKLFSLHGLSNSTSACITFCEIFENGTLLFKDF